MKGIRIVSTGRALPEKQVSNDDLSQIMDTSDEWIYTRTGIRYRHKCEKENESCVSLAVQAADCAIQKADINRDEIGIVIVATQTPDYIFPSAACLVKQELGLGEEVTAFDLSAACTGFLLSLGSARGLLSGMNKKYALVIGSEELSRIMDYTDRTTCILFGDGAGAAVVELADNEFSQKSWSRGNIGALSCPGPGAGEAKLSMNGGEVFKFAVTAMEQGIVEVLEEQNKTLDDIDMVICHQANARIIGHVQKKHPGHEDKFYINVDRYGNTSAASIPIALDELFESGRLQRGMKVVCVAFGAGLTWSSIYMEI